MTGAARAALAVLAASAVTGLLAEDAGALGDVGRAFAACRAIGEGEDRLGCYDGLALKLAPPRFSGRLTAVTDRFPVERPTLIRFQSDGPIFVMYLKDAEENIVQNLHLGGGGEATYLIERPGEYSLQINGSETWRVWLEPQP